jgi:dTDP-4-amino-4,6-dideoxygalactose transaminase
MNIPLLDLKAQYRSLKTELDKAILDVAESQYFILGPKVKELEENIAAYVGTKHAIGVSSGTDALLLAMMALNIGPGDGVLVPTFSFFATAGVVSRLGATPIFVDMDPVSFNIDPEALRAVHAKYTEAGLNIKAICPVHLFGQVADMDPILKFAEEHNMVVVEDCAQAIGSKYKDGRMAGSIGTVGCFSFFPSKNLGGYGDGGIITVNDDELAHRIEIMRVHGGEPKYYHKTIGGNFRLDALQAAVLNVKLPHLKDWSAKRRENADRYNRMLIEKGLASETGKQNFDDANKVLIPKSIYEQNGAAEEGSHAYYHIYNQYCLRVEKRDELIQHLRDNSVGCEIYYPVAFHKQECFADVASFNDAFPETDKVTETIFSIPIYPELTEEMQQYVVDTIAAFFGK